MKRLLNEFKKFVNEIINSEKTATLIEKKDDYHWIFKVEPPMFSSESGLSGDNVTLASGFINRNGTPGTFNDVDYYIYLNIPGESYTTVTQISHQVTNIQDPKLTDEIAERMFGRKEYNVVKQSLPSKEDWKKQGRCPECGELGPYINLQPCCSKHGPYEEE